MSHDTDKLIRQLSLVAFLMAEWRALTARDVKSNVEGYSEMSDEAFARRFYSDRAELVALGVPLQSQRDEFTGEELYTLRSENYFLKKLELDDDELAALQTALYLLEGKFAYAEPLRLALQNLALGRPGFDEPATATAVRVEVLDPDYSPEMPGRLGKLEGAISKQRTIKFPYYSISRNRQGERTVNPYGLLSDKLTLAGAAGAVTQENIGAMGGAGEGFLSAAGYSTDIDTPANKTFVAAFKKEFQNDPDLFGADTYGLFYLFKQAIEKAGSTETAKVRAAKSIGRIVLDASFSPV